MVLIVAVNFSTPDSVLAIIDALSALGYEHGDRNHWLDDRLDDVRKMVTERKVGLVYGSNFSIGVNIFFRLAEAAAKMIREYPEYDPWVYEIHHKAKLDAPSGYGAEAGIDSGEEPGKIGRIPAASNRAGAHPGTHTVGFDSEADTITLTHTARSRLGFAVGALRAARMGCGKNRTLRVLRDLAF